MTFTLTTQPTNVPPRVRMDFNTDDPTAVFTDLTVTRDGSPIREQPTLGGAAAFGFDYEAPFQTPVTYHAIGTYEVPVAADWTETWASLAAWSGDTGSWSVGGGLGTSGVVGAQIVRAATGSIRNLSVSSPRFVRIEFLSSADVVLGSISVTDKTVAIGSGTSVQTAATGSIVATIASGQLTVTGTSISLSTTISGDPRKVRIVSLGTAYPKTRDLAAIGSPRGMAYMGSNIVLILDHANKQVRKYNTSTGAEITGGGFPFSTVGDPRGICWDGTNIYVTDGDNLLVRKFTSSGGAVTTWGTTAYPYGIALNPVTGNLHISRDNGGTGQIRRYSTTGTAVGSAWDVGGTPRDIAVDAAGVSYVTDADADMVRVVNGSGTITASYSIGTDIRGICLDGSGNFFVACPDSYSVRKYTTAGLFITSFSLVDRPYGVTMIGSDVLVTQYTPNALATLYGATAASVGQIIESPSGTAQPFEEFRSTSLDVDEAWLIHPSQPTLSVSIDAGPDSWRDVGINVDVASDQSIARRAASFTHQPIGRPRQVVITNGDRYEGEWTLVLVMMELSARNAVQAIVTDQSSLLLRSPDAFGWDLPDGWYSVGDVTEDRVVAALNKTLRRITLPLTPVDEPLNRRGQTRNYSDLLTEAATYADVLETFDTYLDALAG